MAVVPGGADVLIVTRVGIQGVGTARVRAAGVVGAWILIPAVGQPSKRALAQLAVVSFGTRISVVAIPFRRYVQARALVPARVGGTGIAVVAIGGKTWEATLLRVANLEPVALVSIIANQRLTKGAAGTRVAPFRSVAYVPIVAQQGGTSQTLLFLT